MDKTNEFAKSSLKRLEDEQAKILQKEKEAAIAKAEKAKQKEIVPAVENPVKPEWVNLGILDSSNATEMATPVYPSIAKDFKQAGRVMVEV